MNPRYTFESFTIGESNRRAYAAAKSVAKKLGTQYNPLVICGGLGLGKTHVMHAIAIAIRRERPKARVLYTTSMQFADDCMRAVRTKQLNAFRARYRLLDCLLFDDIQFLLGRDRPEQEFLYIFNELLGLRKQIVITSDRSPKEMPPLDSRLISQLKSGLLTEIKLPDLKTRLAFVREKIKHEGFSVHPEVIQFVAASIKMNVRSLEGALIRLKAYQSMTGKPLTVDDARDILKDAIDGDAKNPVRVKTIQRMVAQKYSVDAKDLRGSKLSAAIVLPRQIAMYLSCVMSDLSPTDIGRAFGGRDGSAVLHARSKVEKIMKNDPFFVELVNRLQADIKVADR